MRNILDIKIPSQQGARFGGKKVEKNDMHSVLKWSSYPRFRTWTLESHKCGVKINTERRVSIVYQFLSE